MTGGDPLGRQKYRKKGTRGGGSPGFRQKKEVLEGK